MAGFDWTTVANAASSLIGLAWNQYMPMTRAQKQAYDLNVQETMRQEQRQEDFFNQYQSIGAQVRQMQESGINPALAAGGINVGSPVSGPSSNAAPNGQAADALSAIMNFLGLNQQIKDAQQGRELAARAADREDRIADSVVRRNNAEAEGREINNVYLPDLLEQDKVMRDNEIRKGMREVEKLGLDIDTVRLQNEYQESLNAFSKLSFEHQERLMPYVEAQYQADIEESLARTKALKAQTATAWKEYEIAKERAEHAKEFVEAELKALQGTADYEDAREGIEKANVVARFVTPALLGALGSGALEWFRNRKKDPIGFGNRGPSTPSTPSKGNVGKAIKNAGKVVKNAGKAVAGAVGSAAAFVAPYAGAAAGIYFLGDLYNWTGSYHDASDQYTPDMSTYK